MNFATSDQRIDKIKLLVELRNLMISFQLMGAVVILLEIEQDLQVQIILAYLHITWLVCTLLQ